MKIKSHLAVDELSLENPKNYWQSYFQVISVCYVGTVRVREEFSKSGCFKQVEIG